MEKKIVLERDEIKYLKDSKVYPNYKLIVYFVQNVLQ